jgi:hypothetical protein
MAGILRRIIRVGGARIAVRAAKTIPVLGAAVAVGLIGHEIKKKGLIKGVVNTALDATPVLGATKNAIEIFTGDWFSDKPTTTRKSKPR